MPSKKKRPETPEFELLEESLKFQQWMRELETRQAQLDGYEELATIRKSSGEVLFSFLQAFVRDARGGEVPPALLLRGAFVSVLTCLIDRDSGARHLLLVRQSRIATGGDFYEHPCGMCDSDTDPFDVALREVEEEAGLTLEREAIHLLNEQPYYTSPGLLDEAGYFFWTELKLPAAEITALDGRRTGAPDEEEAITTVVVPYAEALPMMRNANSLLNLFLYERAQT